MSARFSRVGTLMMFTLSLVILSVEGVLCQEVLVKGVPYVVQRAHLD